MRLPLGVLLLALASAVNADAFASPVRGEVVSVGPSRSLCPDAVRDRLDEAGFDSGEVRHGVEMVQLVYGTVDPLGRPTTATGLVVLPRSRSRVLRIVSFTHGTEVWRGDAPSVSSDPWAYGPALVYGSAGFAAVAPDYLGLGDGPGFHPWMDVPSEVTASLDLLVAARSFVRSIGRGLDGDVLVTGFSQGASAAVGLARALEAGAAPGFRLGALAPISGAYNWTAWLADAASGAVGPLETMFYLAYFLVSWNRVHQLYDSPSEVFRSPYDATMEQLFDGDHGGQDVVFGLPPPTCDEPPCGLQALLTPEAIDMIRHPGGRLAEALRVADGTCTGWSTRAPIRLITSSADEQVPKAHTRGCAVALRRSGAQVRVIDLVVTDHLDSNRLGTAAALRWFSELR